MIKDPVVRAELEAEWKTVRALTNWHRVHMMMGGAVNVSPPEEFYNLPLVLAYSALDHALAQFIAEGVFGCKTSKGKPCYNLGDKIKAAKTGLSWKDFTTVEEGQGVRNDLAHRTKLAGKKNCLRYIDAIEIEFRSWGLLP